MSNDYICIQLDKCIVYLTKKEIITLLQSDLPLYKAALKRGKYHNRHQAQKQREAQKWENEGYMSN